MSDASAAKIDLDSNPIVQDMLKLHVDSEQKLLVLKSLVESENQLLKNEIDRLKLRLQKETAEDMMRNQASSTSSVSSFASPSEEGGKYVCVHQSGFCHVLVLVFKLVLLILPFHVIILVLTHAHILFLLVIVLALALLQWKALTVERNELAEERKALAEERQRMVNLVLVHVVVHVIVHMFLVVVFSLYVVLFLVLIVVHVLVLAPLIVTGKGRTTIDQDKTKKKLPGDVGSVSVF